MRVPTRGDQTLDLIITHMPHFYNKDLVQTFSPFGLSAHFVVLLEPNLRSMRNTSNHRSLTRRDTHPSRKRELGRYLGSIDWSVLDSAPDCESKLQLFQDLVKIGLNTIMPLKTIKLSVSDTFVTSLIVSGSCVAESSMQPKSPTLRPPNPASGGMRSR